MSATPLPYNVRYNADTGTLEYQFQSGWIEVPSSGGTPGGADRDVQFNDNGSFGGGAGVSIPVHRTLAIGDAGGDGELDFVNNGTTEVSFIATSSGSVSFDISSHINGAPIVLHNDADTADNRLIFDVDGSLTVPGFVAFGAQGNVGMYISPNGAGGTTKISPNVDAVNAIDFTMADASTSVLSLDTSARRVGLFTTTPSSNGFVPCVQVAGDMKIDNYLDMGGHNAACLINMVNPLAGLGVSVMTTAQKNALSPNRAGNIVYDTDLGKLCVNNGSAWETITSV